MKFRPGTAGAEMCGQGPWVSIPGLCRWRVNAPVYPAWFKVMAIRGMIVCKDTQLICATPMVPASQGWDKCAATMC